MLNPSTARAGFTLIEIIISLVVLAILFFTGYPSFISWMQNTQIRTAAESILNGMQVARAEAVRRNTAVQLRLTNLTTSDWIVSQVSNPPAADGHPVGSAPYYIQQYASGSGARTAVVSTGGQDTVTFNGMGWVVGTNGDGSAPLTQISVTSTNATSASRPLTVMVSTAGVMRMCDAALDNRTPPDPRACTP